MVRKWEDHEWNTIKELMEKQITKTPSTINGYHLIVKLGKRVRTYQYSEQVGTYEIPQSPLVLYSLDNGVMT